VTRRDAGPEPTWTYLRRLSEIPSLFLSAVLNHKLMAGSGTIPYLNGIETDQVTNVNGEYQEHDRQRKKLH